jgi:hypothetical protein
MKSRRMRWVGHVVHMMTGEECHTGSWGKSRRKKILGRPTRRWEDNIKIYLRKLVWGDKLDPSGSGYDYNVLGSF